MDSCFTISEVAMFEQSPLIISDFNTWIKRFLGGLKSRAEEFKVVQNCIVETSVDLLPVSAKGKKICMKGN